MAWSRGIVLATATKRVKCKGDLMHVGWLWAVFTILAAGGQTLRNALQRELIGALGSIGATQVRFLFGLPFALLFLAAVRVVTEIPLPSLDANVFAWSAFGAIAQIAATALMLAAMRERSFVITIAYIKTEAVQVAIFSLLFLKEGLTVPLGAAIALATTGVLLMSWPKASAQSRVGKSAALGLISASFFALAAVGFRTAILGVSTQFFVMAASLTLVVGLAIQTALLLVWLVAFDRATLAAIFGVWRSSLFAGFLGALASQFWFLAFALASATRVRTLALIEVIFAQAISLRLFREGVSRREWAGMALIVAAVGLLLNG
jgi:drug/metabolite transporter (DMT)-like permease